ncbi:MAG: RNA 2',3'-cyclic phosphodiesterase [Candidatus Tritonobacter lacicola]|nr:RNA 2',3'-cyclic phosphodiesterase [Candidatus Tritonobacter lacicola]
MRTFIAIDLDAAAREAVAGRVRRLAGTIAGVRWVKPDNIHVTIRFLGEISPETRGLVERVLRNAAIGFSPFDVTIGEMGAFPSFRRPRVLWAGIGKGKEELRRLHLRIEEGLGEIGIPAERRPYTPHITIGRLKRQSKNINLSGIARDPGIESGFVVDRVVLFESELRPEGAVHKVIYEAKMETTD